MQKSLRRVTTAALAVCWLLWAGAPAWSEEEPSKSEDAATASKKDDADEPTPESASTESADSEGMPLWVPRDAGAPVTRVGGATRSIEVTKLPTIRALVPEQVGYTLSGQPTLYWHLSEDTDLRVDFTLISGNANRPLVEKTIDGPLTSGVQRIDLASYGVTLETGVSYMWYVSLVPDPERRSEDRVTGGAIERLAASPDLQDQLDRVAPDAAAVVLAGEGIWYDALTSLSDRSAGDPTAYAQRTALLEQVGLSGIHK